MIYKRDLAFKKKNLIVRNLFMDYHILRPDDFQLIFVFLYVFCFMLLFIL